MRKSVSLVLLVILSLTVLATAAHCQSVCKPPAQALLLKMERQQWQALAAVCAVPAFCGRGTATPLVFCDGTGTNPVAIPHDTLDVKALGGNAAAASAAIARRYWRKAPTVFVVDSYEQALWVVPSAAFLQSPILVSPDAGILRALGATKAVVVGRAKPQVAEVVKLDDKTAVWKYQLSVLGGTPRACNYIVMTNPHDTDDQLNPNVQWPYLSLAAAPLAAYRRAIVQTADYTGDRALIHALGVSLGDAGDKVKYATLKPTFQKVKDDSYAAERFLFDAGMPPEYLAMVGGSVELPHYVIDLHTKYTYWNMAIDYVPADTPYACMRDDVDYTRFVQPDLAVGRLMGDTLEDVTLQLQKTFFY
ncbi:MAG: C25 family cysteine peptidase, partial [Armatimonadota bacterium]